MEMSKYKGGSKTNFHCAMALTISVLKFNFDGRLHEAKVIVSLDHICSKDHFDILYFMILIERCLGNYCLD